MFGWYDDEEDCTCDEENWLAPKCKVCRRIEKAYEEAEKEREKQREIINYA